MIVVISLSLSLVHIAYTYAGVVCIKERHVVRSAAWLVAPVIFMPVSFLISSSQLAAGLPLLRCPSTKP